MARSITDRSGTSRSSNCVQTTSAFGFLFFFFGSKVGIRGVESRKLKGKRTQRTQGRSTEVTEKEGDQRCHGKMGLKMKNGEIASSRILTLELVLHSINDLQTRFSSNSIWLDEGTLVAHRLATLYAPA